MCRSRIIVLAIVCAIHALIGALLARLTATSPANQDSRAPLLLLPPTVIDRVPVWTRAIGASEKARPAVLRPVEPMRTLPIAPAPAEPSTLPIDWAAEASRAANAMADSTAPAGASPPLGLRSSPATPSVFEPPPVHRAGESSRNESGEIVVWVSDACYQVSGSLLTVPDAAARALLPRTVCPRKSKQARGDLFKELPAYQKLHPDAPGP